MNTILQDGPFPIVGWAGPGGDMLRPDVMRGMAAGGFTVSHSAVGDGTDDPRPVLRALDIAAEAGMRLLLVHPLWHVGDDFVFDDDRRRRMRTLIEAVRDHPGLYGYHLRDEPRFHMLPLLAEVQHFIEDLDGDHVCYLNHFPPIEGWGAATPEAFWLRYVELARPKFLSYDHYPMVLGTDADIAASAGLPNVFPQEKLIVKSDYFACLELVRTMAVHNRVPFWAFTCSVRHGPYPTPTEGHTRWQLFNNLAYGALGLQYFTYAHDEAMVRADGSTTAMWEIGRQVNREILAMAPVLRGLRSVGVFRTGPVWSGTRSMARADQWPMPKLLCEGDPVTLGYLLDAEDRVHVMVVNGSPCSWSRVTLKLDPKAPSASAVPIAAEDAARTPAMREKLYCFDVKARDFRELWPADPQNQLVTLAPGEGRLFRIGGAGAGVNF